MASECLFVSRIGPFASMMPVTTLLLEERLNFAFALARFGKQVDRAARFDGA